MTVKEMKKALTAAGFECKGLTDAQITAEYNKRFDDDDDDEDEDEDDIADLGDADFISIFSNQQKASREVKLSTGVVSEIISAAEAKVELSKGAKASAKVLEVTNGTPQTFSVESLFTKDGAKPTEWKEMTGGGEWRSVPCFVRCNGLVTLQNVMETRNRPDGSADFTIGAGSIVVAPAVFVNAGTRLLTLIESGDNNGKFRRTVYEKGAWLLTSPFARTASAQELAIMALRSTATEQVGAKKVGAID